ncbi:MAG: lipid IV(A) 3-deoxy-D-manno-octulosonic acid transferase [Pseudomonadales bacterium]
MSRISYTLLYYLLLPVVFLRLWLRGRKAPLYRRRWKERLGFFEAPEQPGGLWLHSVSVGETIAAAPLIKQIQQAYPELPITVTTMTPTGSERVKALFGESVFHVYVPYDTPGAVKRFLRRVKPRLALIMETELWPNLVHHCARQQIPVLIANARLSERSARGYGRFAGLTADMLGKISAIAAQGKADGERFTGLGLAPEKLHITGSVKFDIQVADPLLKAGKTLRQTWGAQRPVWVAASTHQGEDEPILEAFGQVLETHPEALLVLVPRHPERFAMVAELCRARFKSVRRSSGETVTPQTQVLVGDTMGELMLLFAASDIAFVGGSLVPSGGHNFLEPAALALPVLSGPHVFNFADISQLLVAAGGMLKLDGADELARQVSEWLESPALRDQVGQAARSVVEANRGAQQRLFELVSRYLS